MIKKMRVLSLTVVLSLLLVSAVIVSCKSRTSVVPDGLAGVPWGATKDQIITILGKQPHGQIEIGAGITLLQFSGEFAELPCELRFQLIADSFFEGSARTKPTETPQATFNKIFDMLIKKYGPPQIRESRSDTDDKSIDHPYEQAFWRLVDRKSSDTYTLNVWIIPFYGNEAQYQVDVNYRAYSLEERLSMHPAGATEVPTNVTGQAGKKQHAASSPAPPQAAAPDWKQYYQNEVWIYYYDVNSIRRSGDVVQVTILHKYINAADVRVSASGKKLSHDIVQLEINCRSKTMAGKKMVIYEPDGSVISEHLNKPDHQHSISDDRDKLLYHIVCGS